jgi:hypothetical protein
MPGTLLMQGLSNLGQGVNEGIQAYTANKQKDALLTGQIEPYLTQLQSQEDNLSPASASALNKMMTGSATLKDKMLLYGDVASTRDMIAARQQQILGQQAIQQGALSNQMMGAKYNAMQAYANGGGSPSVAPQPPVAQPASNAPVQAPPQGTMPQGAPPPQTPPPQIQPGPQRASTTVNPPAPIDINDPSIRALYPSALAASGYDPTKAATMLQAKVDAVNAQNAANYNQLANTVKDTGRLVYLKPNYTNGVHDFDNYGNEQIKGAGTASQSYTIGDKLIQYAAGTRPPVPVTTAAGQMAPVGQDGSSDAMQQINAVTPYNVNDPKWIADNVQAQTDKGAAAARVANSRLLLAAANAYASGDNARLNGLRASPQFQTMQQLFTGHNPAAALQTALSMNTGGVMNSLRSPQGGTTGARTTAAEFEEADKQLAGPQMDMPTIVAAAQNLNAINERAYNIDSAKAEYRKIMPEDKATSLAISQFGAPPALTAAESGQTTSTAGAAPAMAVVNYKGQLTQVPAANLAAALARGATLVQ